VRARAPGLPQLAARGGAPTRPRRGAGALFGDPLYIHRQSQYLFGREHRVVDVPTDHPSCSKQHAVLQFRRGRAGPPARLGPGYACRSAVRRRRRLIEQEGAGNAVRPYLMDLGSTNGTFLNEERLEPQRYYELLEKARHACPARGPGSPSGRAGGPAMGARRAQDMIKFGNSSREYVLIHEKSAE